MKKRNWADHGALIALLAVWVLCAVCNTGGSWWGGKAGTINMAATGLYIVTAMTLILLAWKKPAWTKTMWRFSWMSLACCLVCWFCSLDQRAWGLLFAPLAGIPFYGLRGFLNWQLTYLYGGLISFVWVVLSWCGVRRAAEKDTDMKSTLKFLAKLAGIAVLCVALFFVNAFAGNPVSALLARVAAHSYVEREYGHLDVQVDKVGYNLKNGNYYAKVSSPTSVDTHFSVYISMLGQVERDTYQSVTQGYNTWERINDQYAELVEMVLEGPDFPVESDIANGDLRGKHDDYPWSRHYGLPRHGLEVDREYDVREFGAQHGSITLYVLDEEVSYRRAAEILTQVRELLDEHDIPFYAMNFVLKQPRDEDGKWSDGPELWLLDFLYTDLHSEDLEEKIQRGHQRAMDYFGEENLLK